MAIIRLNYWRYLKDVFLSWFAINHQNFSSNRNVNKFYIQIVLENIENFKRRQALWVSWRIYISTMYKYFVLLKTLGLQRFSLSLSLCLSFILITFSKWIQLLDFMEFSTEVLASNSIKTFYYFFWFISNYFLFFFILFSL